MRWVAAAVLAALAGGALWHGWYQAWLVPLSEERLTRYLAADAPLNRQLLAIGQLERSPRKRPELARLVESPVPEVRYRAAGILLKLGDTSAEALLKQSRQIHTVYSPYTGQLTYLVKQGDAVRAATPVARVDGREIVAGLSGTVRALYEAPPGLIRTGQRILDIAPETRR
jgi:biotin carboxyl carrier protein